MTSAKKMLSVRLDAHLAQALDRLCAATGAARSHVVKQSLAQYLVMRTGPTLGSLAEAVLPAATEHARQARRREVRQKRFREYVREKRRR